MKVTMWMRWEESKEGMKDGVVRKARKERKEGKEGRKEGVVRQEGREGRDCKAGRQGRKGL